MKFAPLNEAAKRDIRAIYQAQTDYFPGFSSAENLSRDVEVALPPGTTVVDVDPPQVTVTIPKSQ